MIKRLINNDCAVFSLTDVIKVKLRHMFWEDNGIFELSEVVEAILSVIVGVGLFTVLYPVIYDLWWSASFSAEAIAEGGTAMMLWDLIPTVILVMIITGLIFAVIGWFKNDSRSK